MSDASSSSLSDGCSQGGIIVVLADKFNMPYLFHGNPPKFGVFH